MENLLVKEKIDIESMIYEIRGKQVMLDRKYLNQMSLLSL